MKSFYEVIKRPIISEKSTVLAEMAQTYVFEVAPQSNKQEVRQAVEKLFKVKQASCFVYFCWMHGCYVVG